jgi:hypothetical protein
VRCGFIKGFCNKESFPLLLSEPTSNATPSVAIITASATIMTFFLFKLLLS